MKSFATRLMLICCAAGALCAAPRCDAEVSLPAVWADHAVVQRDQPVRVWGKAAPGEKVSVSFRQVGASATADELGSWQVDLPPGDAGGPFTMEIQGTNRIVLTDLLVGDVWFASGQSNMEFSTKGVIHAEEELTKATRPRIRLFQVRKNSSDYPLEDVTAKTWVSCTPESVADFSAVAYFFARNVQDDQKVPIGLIEADWGGTPAETWTSLSALSADAALMPAWATWAGMTDKQAAGLIRWESERKQREAALAEGKPEPKFDWHPELRSFLPGGAFNGMVAPLTRFPIRGVIWYQGESNAGKERAFYYRRLFETLIEDWRLRWNEGDIPFLFVQLANFKTPPDGKWPELRDAQRRTLELANTAMAVTIDIGNADDIHPRNKQEVGRRLALAARAVSYREPIEYSGPLYRTSMREGSSMRVYFDHAAGLEVEGAELEGFELSGADGKFTLAQARVEGSSVVVSSDAVPKPVAVRYGWSSYPACNLYNKEKLPASPFTSEQ